MRSNSLQLLYFFFIVFFSIACQESPKDEKKTISSKLVRPKQENKLSAKATFRKVALLDAHFKSLAKRKSLNGAILVAKGNQVIYQKAFGFTDFRNRKPLSLQAVFQIASVSKQFTAAAIMLLKQRGKLAYEDSIQKFFPEFPYHGITIRHLLTHNSGLTNYTYFCDKLWDRSKPIDNQKVLALMINQKPAPYYPSGRTYDYSNTGYMILAAVVEKVSQTKFEDFLKQQIFAPCKMQNTYVYNHNIPLHHTSAVDGYNYGSRKVGHTYLDGVVGDKGVYSTVHDMYKWNLILFTEKLFQSETLEEAFKPAYPIKKNKDNYGFGWRIKDYHGAKVVWHSGWWEGYKSMFLRNLKDGTCIIILTNSLAGHLKSEDVLDMYYEQ